MSIALFLMCWIGVQTHKVSCVNVVLLCLYITINIHDTPPSIRNDALRYHTYGGEIQLQLRIVAKRFLEVNMV